MNCDDKSDTNMTYGTISGMASTPTQYDRDSLQYVKGEVRVSDMLISATLNTS